MGGPNGGRRNNGGNGANPGASSGSAGGDVALVQQGGGGFQGGGFQMQVSDADCKKIDEGLKAHPKEKKQLDSLRARMQALRPAGFGAGPGGGDRSGGFGGSRPRDNGGQGGQGSQGGQGGQGGGFGRSPEMQAIGDQMRAMYTALNLDGRTAGACLRRQGGSANPRQFAGGQGGGAGSGTRVGTRGQGGAGTQGALTPSPEMGGRPQRLRPGLVYVTDSTKTSFHPRIVQLGQGNLDYTEVVNGLKEGDRVVMLGALALQAQRIQNQDRIRQSASPLGGQPQPGPGGGPRGGGRGG
jgi:hypothetical protein